VSQNLRLLTPTFINEIARRKKNTEVMEKILNDNDCFNSIKNGMGVGKKEEVWR
jgi:hypothetical protein